MALFKFTQAILADKPIDIYNYGNMIRDFTYIDDVARANALALESPWDKWNNIYNIGTGEELTAEAAGKIICSVLGWKNGVETKEIRTVDPIRFVYDITKAKVMLKFVPEYNFEKGLTKMFKL